MYSHTYIFITLPSHKYFYLKEQQLLTPAAAGSSHQSTYTVSSAADADMATCSCSFVRW